MGASDNGSLGSAEIFLSLDSLETIEMIGSTESGINQFVFSELETLVSDHAAFVVRVYDAQGNSAQDTTNFFQFMIFYLQQLILQTQSKDPH